MARMMRPTASSKSKTTQVKENERAPSKKVLPKVKEAVEKVAAKVTGKQEDTNMEKNSEPQEQPAKEIQHAQEAEPIVEKPKEISVQERFVKQEASTTGLVNEESVKDEVVKHEVAEPAPIDETEVKQDSMVEEPASISVESTNGMTEKEDSDTKHAEEADAPAQPDAKEETDATTAGVAVPITTV